MHVTFSHAVQSHLDRGNVTILRRRKHGIEWLAPSRVQVTHESKYLRCFTETHVQKCNLYMWSAHSLCELKIIHSFKHRKQINHKRWINMVQHRNARSSQIKCAKTACMGGRTSFSVIPTQTVHSDIWTYWFCTLDVWCMHVRIRITSEMTNFWRF